MGVDQSTRETEFAAFAGSAYRQLMRTAQLLTGDRYAAEDLVQAALVRVYLHGGRSGSWASPHAYARKAVVNLYATWRRRWRAEVPHGNPESGDAAYDLAEGLDDRLELARALAGLPRAQRTVLVLRFYEDLSVEQTAELLGCSAGTVKSRTNRGLERLRGTGALANYARRNQG